MYKRQERGKLIFGGGMEDCVLETQEEENDLYDGSIAEADVFMDIPNLRQYGTYTCGTTCVQMIMNWLKPYEGDINLTAYEEELGTTEEAGTSPQNILKYFEKNSIVVNAVEKWTIKDVYKRQECGSVLLHKGNKLVCMNETCGFVMANPKEDE